MMLLLLSRPPSGAVPASSVEWLRPSAIFDSPVLFAHAQAVGSVTQGNLGDSWFLSAVGILAATPELLRQLFVTTGQEAQVNGAWSGRVLVHTVVVVVVDTCCVMDSRRLCGCGWLMYCVPWWWS